MDILSTFASPFTVVISQTRTAATAAGGGGKSGEG